MPIVRLPITAAHLEAGQNRTIHIAVNGSAGTARIATRTFPDASKPGAIGSLVGRSLDVEVDEDGNVVSVSLA